MNKINLQTIQTYGEKVNKYRMLVNVIKTAQPEEVREKLLETFANEDIELNEFFTEVLSSDALFEKSKEVIIRAIGTFIVGDMVTMLKTINEYYEGSVDATVPVIMFDSEDAETINEVLENELTKNIYEKMLKDLFVNVFSTDDEKVYTTASSDISTQMTYLKDVKTNLKGISDIAVLFNLLDILEHCDDTGTSLVQDSFNRLCNEHGENSYSIPSDLNLTNAEEVLTAVNELNTVANDLKVSLNGKFKLDSYVKAIEKLESIKNDGDESKSLKLYGESVHYDISFKLCEMLLKRIEEKLLLFAKLNDIYDTVKTIGKTAVELAVKLKTDMRTEDES